MPSLLPLSLLLLSLSPTSPLRVLIYSAPIGFSHVQLTSAIAESLVNAGHNVSVLMPILEEKTRNLASEGATTLFVELPEEMKKKQRERTKGFWQVGALFDNMMAIRRVSDIQLELCEYLLANQHSLSPLLNASYDVAIVEVTGMCGFGLFHNTPVGSRIAVSALGLMDAISSAFDVPVMSSYIPGSLSFLPHQMTFFQRVFNFLWHAISQPLYANFFVGKYEAVFARHGVNLNFLNTLRSSNYFLVNHDEYVDIPRPVSQRVKYIGGIANKAPGKMPEEFSTLLSRCSLPSNLSSIPPSVPSPSSICSSSFDGVVVISFGSFATTSDMPPEMMDAFKTAIDEHPRLLFIWRTDAAAGDIGRGRSNLHCSQWIPQRELLADPRVVLFVSHAGMNSILEVAAAGKPAILVPIFGDQFQNAATLSRKNSSVVLWKSELKGRVVTDAVEKMTTDQGYRIRAARLASLIREKRSSPAERVVEAVEYSGKFGRLEEMGNPGFRLNLIQYFCIDVLFFFAFVVCSLYKMISCLISLRSNVGKVKAE